MSLPAFLRFTPVPLKARHDGWSPDRQFRFIVALARGATPDEAARSLGMGRQSAYALRSKPGAEGFAAAWDEALRFARHVRITAARAQRGRQRPAPAPSKPTKWTKPTGRPWHV